MLANTGKSKSRQDKKASVHEVAQGGKEIKNFNDHDVNVWLGI